MKIKYMCHLISSSCVLYMFLLMSGCVGSSSPLSYYRLASIEQNSLGYDPLAQVDIALGIGPVHEPEYVKRPQIVIRLGDNRFQFS